MSGTSLDGADAVLARFDARDARPTLLAHRHLPFPAELRQTLLDLQSPGGNELDRASMASLGLADHYALLVQELLRESRLDRAAVSVIGAHGQTVRHRPELGFTLQLNAPARLAEHTGIDVVADFRSADVAAGGHGAPLVPAFHSVLFRAADRSLAILNLGGIANLTELPSSDSIRPVRGWDCGTGNVLLDYWAEQHGIGRFDLDGNWAKSGTPDTRLLDLLLGEAWLTLAPPKSTGRDLFNPAWLNARLIQCPELAAADVQATLATFTAEVVARSVASEMAEISEMIVCGGGALNPDLMNRIQTALRPLLGRAVPVVASSRYGIAPEHVEALAFAWLGLRRLADRPGSLSAVTGAKGDRVLGAHYRAPRS